VTNWFGYLCSVIAGAGVWLTPWAIFGQTEAWDHNSYYYVSIPLMSAIAGLLAYHIRSASWQWPIVMLLAQVVMCVLLNDGLGNLFPFVLLFFLFFSIPSAIAAAIGTGLRKFVEHKHAS
jgi:hypothetical protein